MARRGKIDRLGVPSVLVADDDPIFQILAKEYLEQDGFSVAVAKTGAETLAALRQSTPDLLLLDIELPDRSGFDICADVRNDEQLAHLPIIMVTGRNDEASIHRAFRQDANDFITKPVQWNLVAERIRFVLRAVNMQAELHAALFASRAADNAKTRFLMSMGHELRTPLNGIVGLSQVMADPAASLSTAEYRTYAQEILTSGQKLAHTIDDIMESVRVDTGERHLQRQACRVVEFVQDLAQTLMDQFPGRNAVVRYELDNVDEDTTLKLDQSVLERAFTHVFRNALQYCRSHCRISISISYRDRLLTFRIRDNGIGIATEDLERVFEMFTRIDESLQSSVTGAGIGLSISRALAVLHGGGLWLESTPGEGTTAVLQLAVAE